MPHTSLPQLLQALLLSKSPLRYRFLSPVEWATLAYTLLTTLLVLVLLNGSGDTHRLLTARAFVVVGVAFFYAFYRWRPSRFTFFLRYLYPMVLLSFWYPDTYDFSRHFPNLDHFFAQADEWLVGCQPSITFSRALPQKCWSELFHMGYFAYYPLILLTVLSPIMLCRQRFERTAFVVLMSFFFYYLIYLLVPVAGPQYYFHAIGMEQAEAGHFPALGHYFQTHTDMAVSPGPEGFFRSLVEATQADGERPTAAFPSSHVGISTVLLLLLWRNSRRLFVWSLPFYVALCCATVYIQAHYLVDVLGGLLTAPLFFVASDAIYKRWRRMTWNRLTEKLKHHA